MFTRLTDEQRECLARIIEPGSNVIDYGYGDGAMSRWFVERGAKVLAIDWDPPWHGPAPEGLRLEEVSFKDVASAYYQDRELRELVNSATAFLGWPNNASSWGLHTLCAVAPRVVYVGNTFDATACGRPELWGHLAAREVLEHVPDRVNSLIVYGSTTVKREALAEESAGLDIKQVHAYPYGARREGLNTDG